MELLETNDPKGVLLKKSAKHKKELEDEIKLLSEHTEKIVTNALIIGGTLALTYLLISQFSKSKSKGKSKSKKIKLIKDRENGLLFELGENSKLTGKILSLLQSQDERQRLSQKSAQNAMDYDEKKMTGRIMEVYSEV